MQMQVDFLIAVGNVKSVKKAKYFDNYGLTLLKSFEHQNFK